MSDARSEPTAPSPSTLVAAERSRADLRSVAAVSLLAGLCPLIPLPLLDDWAESLVRRRAVRDRLRRGGLQATPGDVEVLAGLERPAAGRGCLKNALLWPLLKLSLYLIRKVFRKVVFVLAVNDAVNAAASLFHDAWLVNTAVDGGVLAPGPDRRLDRDHLRRVRGAMDEAVRGVDARPLERAVRRTFAGSRRLALATARQLGRWARGERRSRGGGAAATEHAVDDLPLEEEERRLGGMVDRLVDAMWLERGYLTALERRFATALAARPATPRRSPPAASPGAPPAVPS
jgi:hypothetical protein